MKTKSIAVAGCLSVAESKQFENLDGIISKGSKTFMAVGQALVAVHDGKLYRRDFPSFEAYASSRGILRRQAYKLMEAVQLTMELTTVPHGAHEQTRINKGNLDRASEKAILKLGSVTPSKRAEVLQSAADKSPGPITEKAITIATARVNHTAVEKPTESDDAGPFGPKQFQTHLDALLERVKEQDRPAVQAILLRSAQKLGSKTNGQGREGFTASNPMMAAYMR